MNKGKTLFAQLMGFVPRKVLEECVLRYKGDYASKGFSCRDQFLAMAFAQLTHTGSLRGLVAALTFNRSCLYHMGFNCRLVSRNTLAWANEHRPWRIYADFATVMMARARELYRQEPLGRDFDAEVFAVDSTTIDLCLTRFPWAKFRRTKSGIKAHTVFDVRRNLPEFIVISSAKVNDVNFLDELDYSPGAYYVFDRGYVDFARLKTINDSQAFFVTRMKRRTKFGVVESRRVDRSTGLKVDQEILLKNPLSRERYPSHLRRVKFFDVETNRRLVFLTNEMTLPGEMIAQFYKLRWRIELFFKWVKQHLEIERFYGYSENAVLTQFWIGVSVFCLLAIARKELLGDNELHEIQEIFRTSVFQKIPIIQAFSKVECEKIKTDSCNPMGLF